jgi:hypothetical protein
VTVGIVTRSVGIRFSHPTESRPADGASNDDRFPVRAGLPRAIASATSRLRPPTCRTSAVARFPPPSGALLSPVGIPETSATKQPAPVAAPHSLAGARLRESGCRDATADRLDYGTAGSAGNTTPRRRSQVFRGRQPRSSRSPSQGLTRLRRPIPARPAETPTEASLFAGAWSRSSAGIVAHR